MKKMFSVLAIVASIGITAVAVTPIESLNAEIDRILAPFRNTETTAELKFSELATDAVRALRLSATAAYRKVGPSRAFGITVDEASYDFGTGATPTTKIRGAIEVDISTFVSQEDINKFGADFEKAVQEFASEISADYGTAATVAAKVINVGVDANNNYQHLAAELTLKIDLNALPANRKVEDVLVTEASATVSIDVKQGVKANIVLVSNPLYRGFQSSEEGLKETIDKLLAQDAAELAKLEGLVQRLEGFATEYGK